MEKISKSIVIPMNLILIFSVFQNHPRKRFHGGGFQAVSTCGLQQHHPVTGRHPQGHAQSGNHFR